MIGQISHPNWRGRMVGSHPPARSHRLYSNSSGKENVTTLFI